MFFLLGNDKTEKNAKAKIASSTISSVEKVKDLFKSGRFPVVTTQEMADRGIAKVLGLVCCRGFDADEAFFGMAAMAQNKGGQGIIGYSENVAFHPDGSKFFSCFGTAVMFERESRDVSSLFEQNDQALEENVLGQNYDYEDDDDTDDLLNLAVDVPYATQPTEEDDPVFQRMIAQKEQTTTLQ